MNTNESKYTGGKWELRSRAMTDNSLVIMADREHDYREICSIREGNERHYGPQDDEDQANGELLASAPALAARVAVLEAENARLRAALVTIDKQIDHAQTHDWRDALLAQDTALAAIAQSGKEGAK